LSRCACVFRTDALRRGWPIGIIFNAKIVGATETGLALFKALESAIVNHIAQIHPGAPRIILGFSGRDREDRQS